MCDRVAIVTGGGSGIGEACAIGLAGSSRGGGSGMLIHLLGRTATSLARVGESIEARGGRFASSVCDVRDRRSVEAAVAECVARHGRVDVLVNNAGVGGGGPTREQTDDQWEAIIATNLTGTFYMTRAVLAAGGMLESGWGRIINIASTGGKQGVVFAAAYTASKHGVVGFTKSLGLELARSGVTVNAVCPGFVETAMARRAREGYGAIYRITSEQMKRRIEERVPIGRYIEPAEVARVVAFLASASAAGITAQAWNVCGGIGNY